MLSDKMQAALNSQLNAEAYSGYLYLSMASYFEDKGLKGMAAWMGAQAREEFFHTSKFYHFIIERNARALLRPIDGPPSEWASPLAAFEDALKHEEKVTGLINNLVDMAKAESDHASDIFLQWFVLEQVEEEASVDEVIQKLKLAGETGPGLFMLDNELAGRGVSPEVAGVMSGLAPAGA